MDLIASLLAVSDVILDAFQFLRRRELDTLQIVRRRFNAVIQNKVSLVCLRRLHSAKMFRGAGRQFVLELYEVRAKEITRFPTDVVNDAEAALLLLNACWSSRVDRIQLYGKSRMSVDFFHSLALISPSIHVNELCHGRRTLDEGVDDRAVLRALQSFGKLKTVETEAEDDANLHICLIRTCFRAGVKLISNEPILEDNRVVENALLEFCFGACDEPYAMRERSLRVQLYNSLESGFLKRWIEVGCCYQGFKITKNLYLYFYVVSINLYLYIRVYFTA